MSVEPPPELVDRLVLPLVWLDTLWVQVGGTLCNIACKHCFVSAGPKVDRHRQMPVDDVRAALDSAVEHGVRAFWFTGGEPFIHPQILELVDLALERGPLGVLTNGMPIDAALASELGRRFRDAPYNLEIRVSLDGVDARENDRVRGKGVFTAACEGIRQLAQHGVEPVVAVTRLDDGNPEPMSMFAQLLRDLGVRRPRVKWIPPFRIGREAGRRGGRAYNTHERLTAEDLSAPDAPHRLQCGTSRTITSRGVFPCPILVDEAGARLSTHLTDALGPHAVDHPACHTCWVESFSCST